MVEQAGNPSQEQREKAIREGDAPCIVARHDTLVKKVLQAGDPTGLAFEYPCWSLAEALIALMTLRSYHRTVTEYFEQSNTTVSQRISCFDGQAWNPITDFFGVPIELLLTSEDPTITRDIFSAEQHRMQRQLLKYKTFESVCVKKAEDRLELLKTQMLLLISVIEAPRASLEKVRVIVNSIDKELLK